MKLRNLRNEREPKLMIIPMIDIIFFLLVFFMMSTLYMVEQKTIPVQLPAASSVQASTDKSIAITVLANGKIMFEQEELEPALLAKRIKVAMKQESNPAFIIYSDRKTEYGNVITALDELKSAGAKRIAVAAERKVE